MDVAITTIQFGLTYPCQMNLHFLVDSSSTIIDIRDAKNIIRQTATDVITSFGYRIYTNFHLITPALIATDPLANSLLLSHRRFKVLDVGISKSLRWVFTQIKIV